MTRRAALRTGAAGAMGIALSACAHAEGAARVTTPARTLIRNATIASGDRTLGNLARGDILIERDRIAAIGLNLGATADETIDASAMVAMPGMIDTHRHMWQGSLRRSLPDATLGEYFGGMLAVMGPLFTPEDVYAGNLLSAVSAIDAGVTNILDWSHIQNSPAHSDAAIAALQASGIRAVFGYGAPQVAGGDASTDTINRYPQDIRRLRPQYFSSEDQLLTLALAPDGPSWGPVESAIADWAIAREVGARITVHIMGPETLRNLRTMNAQGLLRSDTTYVHCTRMQDEAWRIIKDTGGTVSIASTIEMQMGHGIPAVQAALDHGIRPSLSVDVETSAPNDMITQMRSVLTLQRALINERQAAGESNLPALITTKDVFEFATIEGARANGLDAKIGSLTPGKQADLLLLRKDRINVAPIYEDDPIGAIVLGMDTGNIDSVFIAGKAMKRNGRLVGVDLPAIIERSRVSRQSLLARAAAAAQH